MEQETPEEAYRNYMKKATRELRGKISSWIENHEGTIFAGHELQIVALAAINIFDVTNPKHPGAGMIFAVGSQAQLSKQLSTLLTKVEKAPAKKPGTI